MTTPDFEPTVRPHRGSRHAVFERRTVEIDASGAPDVENGMRPFAPGYSTINYTRHYCGGGVWSPWRAIVVLRGPRRLASGALSDRTMCDATFRDGADENSMYAIPSYLRALVEEYRPKGEQ